MQVVGGHKKDLVPFHLREPRAPAPEEKKEDGFWSELGNDIRQWLFQLDQEKIEDFGRLVKSAGSGLKGAWKQVRDIPRRFLDLPLVKERVGEGEAERWADVALNLGQAVGFTAAGGHALAGLVKALQGKKKGDTSKVLDGLVDTATAAVIAASVGGMGLARAIAAPIGSGLNALKGGYNAARGFKERDGRKQVQGVLDATRSVGSIGRMLSAHSVALKVVGVGLAPIAGALQAGRGMHDLATGLRNDDNKKELKGLVDIATAVGTAMAFASGVAIIPGIALAVTANLAKLAYQLSPRVRKKMDRGLDKLEPGMAKVVEKTDRWTAPIRGAWRKLMGRWVKQVDAESPERISAAQLSEITNLFHADGRYTRDERKRLEIVLEALGQKEQLPDKDAAPPPLDRAQLRKELGTSEERTDFMRFMLVCRDYDLEVEPQETAYLDELARELGIPPESMEKLRQERRTADDDKRVSVDEAEPS